MTPEEMVAAVQAVGGGVTRFSDGKAKLSGPIPADVLHAIKENREAFLEAWETDQKDRWDRVPPENLLLRKEAPRWRQEVYRRVERYVRSQNAQVTAWAVLRATAYRMANEFWDDKQCTAAALADVLHWQLGRFASPEGQLAIHDEVIEHGKPK